MLRTNNLSLFCPRIGLEWQRGMADIGEILQKQLLNELGKHIIITQKNGTEVSGRLIEVSPNHITIKTASRLKTILTEMIGGWDILVEEEERADTETESSSHTPASELPHMQSSQANLSSNHATPLVVADSFEQQVQGRLAYIEDYIAGKIRGVNLKVLPPDFTNSSNILKGSLSKEAFREWQRIKQKYDNAVKLNELGSHFGRIQPIVNDFKVLVGRVPSSPTLRRHLAYFQYIASNIQEALRTYLEASFLSFTASDWYNVAALSLSTPLRAEVQAIYALGQVFRTTALTSAPDGWYCYIGLLQSTGNATLLREIYSANTRKFSEVETQYLLLASIYLLKRFAQKDVASVLVRGILKERVLGELLQEAMSYLSWPPDQTYKQQERSMNELRQQFLSQIKPTPQVTSNTALASKSNSSSKVSQQAITDVRKKTAVLLQTLMPQLQGQITSYKRDRGYGFVRGADEIVYYFHHSAVGDEDVLVQLESLDEETLPQQEQIPVSFEATQGPMGHVAINISRQRVIDKVFEQANAYAHDGDYIKAVTNIKKVLATDPAYPHAQELYEKWKGYARIAVLPRGSTPYARAKRLQMIEKDYEEAINLFYEAIRLHDNTESAVKDLATVLMQLGHAKEAVLVLEEHRHTVTDQQPIDNLLINAYQKAGNYASAIALLQKNLNVAMPRSKQAHLKWQIAICYLRQEDYIEAEDWFHQVIDLGLPNKAAQRNLAFCLIKLQRYEEAEQLLTVNLADAQSAELLKAIEQVKTTGRAAEINEMIPDMVLADFSSEISPFARFFLGRCTYEGVPPVHVQENRFERGDVRRLEELATKLGTRRPRERAEYYLSAAAILWKYEDWEDNYNQLYKYLCRSFASRGDAAVIENKPLDSAREWYCEALSVYDGNRSRNKGDEQDAVNALVRFLFATLGRTAVPTEQVGFDNLSINENLEKILHYQAQQEKIFDAIAYLVFRSQFAANRILTRLHAVPKFQEMALDYLKSRGIEIPTGMVRQQEFSALWKKLQLHDLEQARTASIELRSMTRVELTEASVEASLQRLRIAERNLFFDLDQQRVGELQKILEAMLDLTQQYTFEEQERFCTQIENRCKDLLQEIEANPTSLSVEELYPIVETIQRKTAEYLEEIYASSVPQLALRLPKSMDTYISTANYQRIEVQIVIENRMGCSPAEAVELIVQEESNLFTVEARDLKLNGSLRGGEQRITLVPIRITEHALHAQAFSLPIYLQYRTRSGETLQTPIIGFSINLYSVEHFERIENPYAAYAQGGIVAEEKMFYGRSELITNIAEAICNARLQSKSIIIFGQKRSGKSSILYHLKKRLQQEKKLLVLDLETIGTFLDIHSQIPLLHQILYCILNELENIIEDEMAKGRPPLPHLVFPLSKEFYEHPTPLRYFQELLKRFKRTAAKTEMWQDIRLVLLIDEFSYLYGYIMDGHLSPDFMKNWKALLQVNLFSAVLAGQDVMPKFKELFPNDFGITEDKPVSYLQPEDAEKLIDEPIRIGGPSGESRYRERAIARILDLTAGSPFYIQIICNRLVEYMNRKQAKLVTEADVEQVKNELIEGTNPLGWEHFDNLTNSGDTSPDAIPEEDARAILKKIAINSRTGPCSRSSILVETQKSISDILKDLETRKVVEVKHGQYYAIRVDLFKEWLLTHQ